ncbi:MAG: hypothetical protein WCK15_05620 [Pirellula sp.]
MTNPELILKFRERIRDILLEEPFLGRLAMDHTVVAEALIQSAFARYDFNGGIDDTCHAAKKLHRLVDKAGALKNSEYSPAKLQSYLKKTKHSV